MNGQSKATVGAVQHRDKRTTIPTEELRDFVADEEKAPKTVLYPRDPSLDPQLVWAGKDEQDTEDLAVPSVPIYVQEKILPQALIEDLRRQSRQEAERQANLFADFDDVPFEDLVEFYRHEQNWANRLILGDALLVMTSLAEKEGLKGKVQTLYLDPPYGIKFGSNWQVSTRKRDVKDGKAEDLTRQPEQVRAFRDTWELGIHSYLAYLRDRLVAARELLTESGSIFVQIGDENVHLVRALLDEVFGSDNFCSMIQFQKTSGAGSLAGGTDVLASVMDYIIWYAKDAAAVKYRPLYTRRPLAVGNLGAYTWIEMQDGKRRRMTPEEKSNLDVLPSRATVFRADNLTSQSGVEKTRFPVHFAGRELRPNKGVWKTSESGMQNLINARRLILLGDTLSYVRFATDFPMVAQNNLWTDTIIAGYSDPKVYVVQTSTRVVERCLLMTTDPGDLVLDPTCGSGTTAYVAEQWGRRWITIDTSRVALALARTRIMAARFPYYLLADSPEGIKQEAQLTGLTSPDYRTEGDIKKGFVYKRVPHVTLKSIANNPDIHEGMSRQEIDAAIARHADSETLYDQPYTDPKRHRVAGPFTVESLSPHRMLTVDEQTTNGHVPEQKGTAADPTDFVQLIVENLKKAGVQNTVKGERLVFDRLEPYAGEWIQASGEYTEYSGDNQEHPVTRRVAICIGPEHGTVDPGLVKDAAKEAVRGVGFDLLVVCGFAFDPHVSEEAKRYGRLTVLPARMNADLMMGDALKATGSGNLFTVFGEPDVEMATEPDGRLTVTIKGVDVYDPTTGQVRSNSVDDIACWFLDTAYDEQAFIVRHAYFTGADRPYERLQKALRAEIDEAAWASLYATTSRPFDPPKTGRIAVKVINHYGDEVLKVYPIK
ncbi:MAG: site-specific DNA-methyltransferase [Chloroflexota bacterium]|nr:site-specific DNA-methyltransferase [Chloroflexota bacterium]